MTPTEFAYWLQGYMELAGDQACLDSTKTQIIKQHLDLVFEKVTNLPLNEQVVRKKLLVDELPQGALARYERDVRSVATILSRRC